MVDRERHLECSMRASDRSFWLGIAGQSVEMLSGNSLFWSVIGVLWSVDLVPCIRFEIGSCVVQYLEPCSQEIIKFYLFSSNRHENGPILINPDNITLPKWVNWRHSNKLIVHGYGGSLEYHATKAIRNGE